MADFAFIHMHRNDFIPRHAIGAMSFFMVETSMMSIEAYIAFQQRRIDMITQSELQIIKQATYSKDQIRPNEIKERQETFKSHLDSDASHSVMGVEILKSRSLQ